KGAGALAAGGKGHGDGISWLQPCHGVYQREHVLEIEHVRVLQRRPVRGHVEDVALAAPVRERSLKSLGQQTFHCRQTKGLRGAGASQYAHAWQELSHRDSSCRDFSHTEGCTLGR